jgi:hypothetical protein
LDVTFIPISYIQRSVLSAFSRNRGRSWNVLPVYTGVLPYSNLYRKKDNPLQRYTNIATYLGVINPLAPELSLNFSTPCI